MKQQDPVEENGGEVTAVAAKLSGFIERLMAHLVIQVINRSNTVRIK